MHHSVSITKTLVISSIVGEWFLAFLQYANHLARVDFPLGFRASETLVEATFSRDVVCRQFFVTAEYLRVHVYGPHSYLS